MDDKLISLSSFLLICSIIMTVIGIYVLFGVKEDGKIIQNTLDNYNTLDNSMQNNT